VKIANPELKVITFSGDGNGLGEGLAHALFAAKRNQDMTLILHDNSVNALTTGQFSPLSETGWKGPSTPEGSIEKPFNAVSLLIEAGATFVARAFSGELTHLISILIEAIKYEGFSFLEILQSAVPYHSWEEYREKVAFQKTIPKSKEEALITANKAHRYVIGIFYQAREAFYHEKLYGKFNPVKNSLSRTQRLEKLREILKEK